MTKNERIQKLEDPIVGLEWDHEALLDRLHVTGGLVALTGDQRHPLLVSEWPF